MPEDRRAEVEIGRRRAGIDRGAHVVEFAAGDDKVTKHDDVALQRATEAAAAAPLDDASRRGEADALRVSAADQHLAAVAGVEDRADRLVALDGGRNGGRAAMLAERQPDAAPPLALRESGDGPL